MDTAVYAIENNSPVTRWWVSPMGRRPFEAPVATFDAPVNQGEGYVQIVYPVRRRFLQEMPIRSAAFRAEECTRLYFPFEGNRVDFTTFINTPHHIWVHARTVLAAPAAGEYAFDLYTCGGVRLWVNGEEITCFTPYTRNIASRTGVVLPLKEGDNEIAVYADELAERDVFFYFELRCRDERPLQTRLPLDVPAAQLAAAERFLTACWFPRDIFTGGEVTLAFPEALPEQPLDIWVAPEGSPDEPLAAHTVRTGMGGCPVAQAGQLPAGMMAVLVCCKVGGHTLRRRMVIGAMPPKALAAAPAATLAERKQQALRFAAEGGENHVNRALAILATGGPLEGTAMECIDISLRMVEAKADCADFYLPVLLILYTSYANLLPESLLQRIKAAALGFRYWIDEPGNDVMWYFSENHALLFHISQYLAGRCFPQEVFTASGRTGAQQMDTGRRRIVQWFGPFLEYGYAEWNSATYIPVDLIGLFALYLAGTDGELAVLVRQGLDMTFRVMEYNSFYGVMTGSYGRAYEETLKGYHLVEPNFFSWITRGEGTPTAGSRAATLYALAAYTPPAAHEEVQTAPGEWLEVEWDQGINRVKTFAHRTSAFALGCVRRYKPYTHGHQQHLMHAALGSAAAPFFINHPGERLFSGGNRPAYWAGNGTMPFIEQYRALLVMRFKTDADELVHAIHAYAPLYLYDEYQVLGNWFFARAGEGYLAAWFSEGYTVTTAGANTGKELLAPGLHHTVLVRCGCPQEFGPFAAFVAAVQAGKPTLDGQGLLRYTDDAYGEAVLSGEDEWSINGEPTAYTPCPRASITKGAMRRVHG